MSVLNIEYMIELDGGVDSVLYHHFFLAKLVCSTLQKPRNCLDMVRVDK